MNNELNNDISLQEIKDFMRIDTDIEDKLLQYLLLTSVNLVENILSRKIINPPADLKYAILLLINYLYSARDPGRQLPNAIQLILNKYRDVRII